MTNLEKEGFKMNYDRIFSTELAADVLVSLDAEIWMLEGRVKDIDMLSVSEYRFSSDKEEEIKGAEKMIEEFKKVETYYKKVYGSRLKERFQ